MLHGYSKQKGNNMAKGKLSNKEKWIILGMTQQDKTLAEISKETGRDEQAIIDFLATTVQKSEEVVKAEPQPEKKKKSAEERLVAIKKKKSKLSRYRRLSEQEGVKGVSVMTGAKAMITDDIRKNPRLGKPRSNGAIYHPKDGTTT